MPELVDTHCHLDFDAFEPDLDAVLQRSREAGVTRVVDPGVDLPSSRTAVRLAEDHPGVFAAVGIHPNETAGWQPELLVELETLAAGPRVAAIGEIGLDFYRDRSPRADQEAALLAQLELAARLNLPVILHTRQSLDETLEVVSDWTSRLRAASSPLADRPGIFHAFEGSLNDALRAAEMNFMIGIGGPVTFQNAAQKREIAAGLPLERIVFETDAPFLAPHPHRGQRNEPAYICIIAEMVAKLRGQSLASVAEMTSENAKRLFAWSQ